MKLLLYCTKAKPYLVSYNNTNKHWYLLRENEIKPFSQLNTYNGKIVAECDFEVEKILPIDEREDDYEYGLYDSRKDLVKESCLSNYDIYEYLQDDDGEIFNKGYAIHIKNIHIFDKPKELSEYYSEYYVKDIGFTEVKLRKAPQNMQYCYNVCNQKYILISIRPQWLCKILNGEKTIEVRKKVIKRWLE